MTELPMGWVETTLAGVTEVRLGRQRSPKTHTGSNMRPYLRAANVTWRGLNLSDVKEMHFSPEEVETYRLRPGDVLVAEASGTRGEVGKAALWSGEIDDCCFQNTLLRVRTLGPGSKYLLYFLGLEALSGRLGTAARGVGIHHLGAAGLSSYPIPVAPLAEQKRIVATIEEQFSRLDESSHLLRSAGRRLQSLRGGLTKRAIDSIAGGVVPLGDICGVAGGATPKGVVLDAEGEVLFYKVGDMNVGDGHSMAGSRTYVSRREAERLRLRIWPAGTVIFPKQGGAIATNKKRVLARPAACDLNIMGVTPGSSIRSDYLYLFLTSVDLRSLSDGSVVPQIKLSTMRELPIRIPDLEVQDSVVEIADAQLSVIDALTKSLGVVNTRGRMLRSSILERAFTGRLVPQDPSDEPASELVARIAADRVTTAKPRRMQRA